LFYFDIFLDGQPPRTSSRSRSGRTPGLVPGLAEDYAEIVDEEGDYSSPAKDYELERSRIELSEIIGELVLNIPPPPCIYCNGMKGGGVL